MFINCLYFNTVAYTQSEAIYRWNKDRQIVIASGMKMSQFDLVSTPVSNYTISFKHGINIPPDRFNLYCNLNFYQQAIIQ